MNPFDDALFLKIRVDEAPRLFNRLHAVGIDASSASPVRIIVPGIIAPMVVVPVTIRMIDIIEVEVNHRTIVIKRANKTTRAETVIIDLDGSILLDEIDMNHTVSHCPLDMVSHIVPRSVAIVINPVARTTPKT